MTTRSNRQATLLATLQGIGATANIISPQFTSAGYDSLLVLGNLSAITAGSVQFRIQGIGAFYIQDLYKITETAAGSYFEQSIGPSMQTNLQLLPVLQLQCDVTTGPATFTCEVWGY